MLDTLFLDGSAWTRPIDPCATYSEAGRATSVPVGFDTWMDGDLWSIPIYVARTTDPQRTLLYNQNAWLNVAAGRWQRFGNSRSVEQDILRSSETVFPFPGNVYSSTSIVEWVLPPDYNKTDVTRSPEPFQLPSNAVPAPGPDGHLAAQQPNGKVVETYGTIVLGSGEVVALSYSVTDPHSQADGWQNGQTASMIPMYAGVIDDQEVASGHIEHAMAVTLPAALLQPAMEKPAYAFDRNAMTGNPPYAGAIPMGTRLALPDDVSPSSLPLYTDAGRIIAQSARTFGFIVVDRGGEGISIRVRKNPASPNWRLHTWNQAMQADLATIFQRIKRVATCQSR